MTSILIVRHKCLLALMQYLSCIFYTLPENCWRSSNGLADQIDCIFPSLYQEASCIFYTLPENCWRSSNGLADQIDCIFPSLYQEAYSSFKCCAGFLSPASRGALLTAMLVSYLLLAVTAGLGSVWLWGILNRTYEGWQAVAWRVAAYFPGITLLTMSLLNILIHHTGSSGSIPLGAFFSLIALWFLISIPLCFSGELLKPQLWACPFASLFYRPCALPAICYC